MSSSQWPTDPGCCHSDKAAIIVPQKRPPKNGTVCACCACGCSFDLVFLDANKDGYQSYYNTILDKHLLAPGGLLVVDNTLMKVVCVCVGGGGVCEGEGTAGVCREGTLHH